MALSWGRNTLVQYQSQQVYIVQWETWHGLQIFDQARTERGRGLWETRSHSPTAKQQKQSILSSHWLHPSQEEPNPPQSNSVHAKDVSCRHVGLFLNRISISLIWWLWYTFRKLGAIWRSRDDLATIYISRVAHLGAEFTVHSSGDGPRARRRTEWEALSGSKKLFHFVSMFCWGITTEALRTLMILHKDILDEWLLRVPALKMG